MTHTKRTYIKSLLLLIVFSLNTIVSFACSFGGAFHDFHHQKISSSTSNKHEEGHKHSHNSHEHDHTDSGNHEHHKGSEHKHDSSPVNNPENNCCSDSVVELQKVDKLVSSNIQAPDAVFVTSFIGAYFDIISFSVRENRFFRDNIRWRPPATIQDLRIVIQSFQI